MKKLFLIVVVCFFAGAGNVFAGDVAKQKQVKLSDVEFVVTGHKFKSKNSAYKVDNLVKDWLYSGKVRTYGYESPSITYVIKDGRARVQRSTNINVNDVHLIERRIRMVAFPAWPVKSFKTIYSMN